jgi:hypothetical protein
MYVPLLVFTEQEPRYQAYIQYYSDRIWPACNANIDPLKGVIATYACPSDSESAKPSSAQNNVTRISYHTSWGDAVYNVCETRKNPRGFAAGANIGTTPPTYCYISTASISDGTSNTLAVSEGACAAQTGDTNVKGGTVIETTVKPSTCNTRRNGAMLTGTVVTTTNILRGSAFADGRPRTNGIQTILPPNAPSCAIADANPGQASSNGFMTASSYHPGLVNALVCDASVRPVIDAIDVGNSTVFSATYNTAASEPTGISPLGLWGAFGTIAGDETIELP